MKEGRIPHNCQESVLKSRALGVEGLARIISPAGWVFRSRETYPVILPLSSTLLCLPRRQRSRLLTSGLCPHQVFLPAAVSPSLPSPYLPLESPGTLKKNGLVTLLYRLRGPTVKNARGICSPRLCRPGRTRER